ncbi:hypothetical protein HK102_004633, partial [Quaeritorhiza haematococci]
MHQPHWLNERTIEDALQAAAAVALVLFGQIVTGPSHSIAYCILGVGFFGASRYLSHAPLSSFPLFKSPSPQDANPTEPQSQTNLPQSPQTPPRGKKKQHPLLPDVFDTDALPFPVSLRALAMFGILVATVFVSLYLPEGEIGGLTDAGIIGGPHSVSVDGDEFTSEARSVDEASSQTSSSWLETPSVSTTPQPHQQQQEKDGSWGWIPTITKIGSIPSAPTFNPYAWLSGGGGDVKSTVQNQQQSQPDMRQHQHRKVEDDRPQFGEVRPKEETTKTKKTDGVESESEKGSSGGSAWSFFGISWDFLGGATRSEQDKQITASNIGSADAEPRNLWHQCPPSLTLRGPPLMIFYRQTQHGEGQPEFIDPGVDIHCPCSPDTPTSAKELCLQAMDSNCRIIKNWDRPFNPTTCSINTLNFHLECTTGKLTTTNAPSAQARKYVSNSVTRLVHVRDPPKLRLVEVDGEWRSLVVEVSQPVSGTRPVRLAELQELQPPPPQQHQQESDVEETQKGSGAGWGWNWFGSSGGTANEAHDTPPAIDGEREEGVDDKDEGSITPLSLASFDLRLVSIGKESDDVIQAKVVGVIPHANTTKYTLHLEFIQTRTGKRVTPVQHSPNTQDNSALWDSFEADGKELRISFRPSKCFDLIFPHHSCASPSSASSSTSGSISPAGRRRLSDGSGIVIPMNKPPTYSVTLISTGTGVGGDSDDIVVVRVDFSAPVVMVSASTPAMTNRIFSDTADDNEDQRYGYGLVDEVLDVACFSARLVSKSAESKRGDGEEERKEGG